VTINDNDSPVGVQKFASLMTEWVWKWCRLEWQKHWMRLGCGIEKRPDIQVEMEGVQSCKGIARK